MYKVSDAKTEQSINVWLSVIVPVYEVEDYITQCLKSIVDQKANLLGAVEIIVIDDGSLDNSGKIADCFANKYSFVKVIHKQNEGVAAARNTGIEAASGEWLYFVDSDDWLAEQALTIICEKCRQYQEADILLFDAYQNTAKGEKNWEHFAHEHIWTKSSELRSLQLGALYFPMAAQKIEKTRVPLAAPWDKIYRREFVREHELWFREDLYVLDDMIFCMEAFGEASKVAYCKEKIYHYRYVADSITNGYRPDRVKQDAMVWEYLRRYENRQIEKKAWTDEEKSYFEQAFYSRIIKSYSICCRLCFFNPQNEKMLHDKIGYAMEVLRTEPYAEAFQKVKISNLEWKLKIITIVGRAGFGVGIYLLHLVENIRRSL